MNNNNYDVILNAIGKRGIDVVRKIVYGNNVHCEVEAMRLFIERRQNWAKDKIMGSLK